MVSVLGQTIVRADLCKPAGTRHNAAETAWEIIFVMENRPCLHWRTIRCDLWPDGTVTECVSPVFFSSDSKRFGGKLSMTFTVRSRREQSDRFVNVGFICRKEMYESPITLN